MRFRTVSADHILLAAIRASCVSLTVISPPTTPQLLALVTHNVRSGCLWGSIASWLSCFTGCHPTPLFPDERSSSECSPLICETVLKEKLSKQRLLS
jgi:hypothetical protein